MNDGLGAALNDFSRAMFVMLASPWALWAGLMVVTLTAAFGVAAGVGEHPIEGPWAQLGGILLASNLLARAITRAGRLTVGPCVAAAGVAVLLIGGALAGARHGALVAGGGAPTEAYTRNIQGQKAPVHLGSQLSYTMEGDAVTLRLGVGAEEVGAARVELAHRGLTEVGPWAMYVDRVVPGDAPDQVTLSAKVRGAEQAHALVVAVPGVATLPDGSRLSVERVSGDYGQRLGAAARIRLDWKGADGADQNLVTWLFLEHPTLDERVGTAPWSFTLDAVTNTPQTVMGVHRRGQGFAVAATGWVVLILGLVLVARERVGEEGGDA